jgi:peptidyl-dipeptidase Dcp
MSANAPPAHAKLLAPWSGPYGGVPPWDEVGEVELFVPAMEAAAAQLEAEVEAIAQNPEAPTFENTLVALEEAGEPLERVATLFFTLTSSLNTPEVQEASKTIRPLVARVQDRINFDSDLFSRVEAVYEDREGLDREARRLVEKVRREMVRKGANLSPEDKEKLGELNQALAKLFTEFANRVLADEDTWVVLGEEDLAGLPPSLVETYAAAAKKRDIDGYAVVNTRSAVAPFLTFSTRRDLREKVWRRFVMRGDNGDENDTNALIQKIVALRAQRAKLLGYPSHAHWRMADTMAKTPENAMDLMMRVWPAAVKKVEAEVAAMEEIARGEGHTGEIEPWDYRYYMEKVREAEYDLDQTIFKNYFELDNMIEASYFMARKLYGLEFEEITGSVPTFHPDVRVYEVTRAKDGAHVGLFYRDDFARQHKRSGAWMSSYRTQEKVGAPSDPIVSNNNNFTPSAEGEPVLISLDDAETLFHEFGHALHGLLDDTTYPTLSHTPRDFVEFPSQVHENWVLTRDVLDRFARHYETGEKMPEALIDKMRAAATFNQGFATVEYLAAAIVDMKLHTDPDGKVDPAAFEKEALAEIGMPEEIVLRHRLPHFMHLFASDAYSAGYYSYLWSDVMAADAWGAFEETGDPWNPEVAEKFATIILATGDALDRADAYRAFRGRDPQVEALLENRGLN